MHHFGCLYPLIIGGICGGICGVILVVILVVILLNIFICFVNKYSCDDVCRFERITHKM